MSFSAVEILKFVDEQILECFEFHKIWCVMRLMFRRVHPAWPPGKGSPMAPSGARLKGSCDSIGMSINNPTNEAVVVNGSAPTFTFAGTGMKPE